VVLNFAVFASDITISSSAFPLTSAPVFFRGFDEAAGKLPFLRLI